MELTVEQLQKIVEAVRAENAALRTQIAILECPVDTGRDRLKTLEEKVDVILHEGRWETARG